MCLSSRRGVVDQRCLLPRATLTMGRDAERPEVEWQITLVQYLDCNIWLQVYESQVQRLIKRVQLLAGYNVSGSGYDWPDVQVFSKIDI